MGLHNFLKTLGKYNLPKVEILTEIMFIFFSMFLGSLKEKKTFWSQNYFPRVGKESNNFPGVVTQKLTTFL